MRNYTLLGLALVFTFSSCVSKKKLTEEENKNKALQEEVAELRSEKDNCQENVAEIEDEMESYDSKIAKLQGDNDRKIDLTENGGVISGKTRKNIKDIFKNIPENQRNQAKTLEDSINLAVAHNIKANLAEQFEGENAYENIDVKVDKSIVLISLTDKILFKSGSYWVDSKSHKLIEKIANVINSEPNIEVRVEGHTDNKAIVEGSFLEDNWDLSVRRAASVVRTLENKFGVNGDRMIASGRSEFSPVADNSTAEGRQLNRRTTILLLPDVKKYMEILDR
ncbi:OmpA family protein [Psychroflexus aestuariivivens]|uniref:OmpA family protein n=1 Tax=Psychroflexus aestuariivivens TaxID=1795040 RepID=UPI000FDAC755|nr:OmpA family protein [Psychroflexus aestuariivivens]